jgi:hypothetical protein
MRDRLHRFFESCRSRLPGNIRNRNDPDTLPVIVNHWHTPDLIFTHDLFTIAKIFIRVAGVYRMGHALPDSRMVRVLAFRQHPAAEIAVGYQADKYLRGMLKDDWNCPNSACGHDLSCRECAVSR